MMDKQDDLYTFNSVPKQEEGGYFDVESTDIQTQVQPAAVRGPTASRAQPGETARPMTSVVSAGYPGTSAAVPGSDLSRTGFCLKPVVSTPEGVALQIEREIHEAIEEAATCSRLGDLATGLKKAKQAATLNKKLETHRTNNNLGHQQNADLAFCAHFTLGCLFQANRMYDEALRTFKFVAGQKKYMQGGRVRVNMGNIFYEQEKYEEAIRQYQMAEDSLPNTTRELKCKVHHNIANCYMRLGRIPEAVKALEYVMENAADIRNAMNLIVCYFALRDREKLKWAFGAMASARKKTASAIATAGASSIPFAAGDDDGAEVDSEPRDELWQDLQQKRKEDDRIIVDAAQLIVPQISADPIEGYDWIADTLGISGADDLVNQIEIIKALQYMRHKEFDKAVETLKAFEKKDHTMAGPASTNLSFLYYLEHDVTNAEKYADTALHADRFNSKALVNKGNCLASRGNIEEATDLYLEALASDSDCLEAMYNLGLAYKRSGNLDLALQSFIKLNAILPHDPQVVYQLASIQEKMGNTQQAIRWLKLLNSLVPSDPGILAHLGELHARSDDTVAYQYYMESYRFFPANLNVVSWLGAYYVKSEAFEKAIPFFQRAWQLQPGEAKWQLMVANCMRRTMQYQQALEIYQDIHRRYPDNLDCLRYLVQICNELGLKEELSKYLAEQREIEAQQAQRPPSPNRAMNLGLSAGISASTEVAGGKEGDLRLTNKREEEDWNDDMDGGVLTMLP